jgi:hypothetical protein
MNKIITPTTNPDLFNLVDPQLSIYKPKINLTKPTASKPKERRPLKERYVVAILTIFFVVGFYLLVFGLVELVGLIEYLNYQ